MFYGPLGRLLWPEAEILKINHDSKYPNSTLCRKKIWLLLIVWYYVYCLWNIKKEKYVCFTIISLTYVPNFNKSLIYLHVSLSRIIVCLWFYSEMTKVIRVVNLILYNLCIYNETWKPSQQSLIWYCCSI